MGSGYVMLVNTSTSLLICCIESICCDANQQIWRISFKDVLRLTGHETTVSAVSTVHKSQRYRGDIWNRIFIKI